MIKKDERSFSTKASKTQWQDDFPMREEVEHFSGKTRVFSIDCHQGHLGYTLHAREEGVENGGYEFGAYSETSPYSALGQLRVKMRRALATRHISGKAGKHNMLHDRMRGHIEWSQERGVSLVVDGTTLGIDELAVILGSYEGWTFDLRIKDSLE